ncbi:Palmitoyltransferase [Plasmodium coatneyi]|uniref:Palmitoyltransferase n=1 Tax=Plasmodium coatneyi TaxID=208452 RepID=A0A1B1DV79_9APIC|nr:Palmitoyltransferase [Plasmodium coatneyi]ANQ06549.1 Palmitoyltransferase [Plasmodium coatneyi]
MKALNVGAILLAFYRSFFVLLTHALILQSMYLCTKFISTFATKVRVFSYASFWFCTLMTLWCHVKCLIKNPGVLTGEPRKTGEGMDAQQDRDDMCMKCNLLKEKRSHHCSVCNRCIIKMDHHCIWINGCVGQYNQKFFILLNFYTLLMCTNCAFIVMYKMISCVQTNRRLNTDRKCILSRTDLFLIVVNTFGSLLFGVFTLVMLVDQYVAIRTNTTGIEYLKNQRREMRPFRESLVDVFGQPFCCLWFLPIDGTAHSDFSSRENFIEEEKKN